MKTILAAIDLTPLSQSVVAAAADLARLSGARLILTHVLTGRMVPPPIAPFESNYAIIMGYHYQLATDPEVGGFEAERREKAACLLEQLAEPLAGIGVETLVGIGDAADEILRLAD